MESLTSAAAFVEGGIQDACDDACSICLENFCESDPCALTGCKHEFHLQCILQWCQRSLQCPMCWQPISMKDPTRLNRGDFIFVQHKARNGEGILHTMVDGTSTISHDYQGDCAEAASSNPIKKVIQEESPSEQMKARGGPESSPD